MEFSPEFGIAKAFGKLLTEDFYNAVKGHISLQKKLKSLKVKDVYLKASKVSKVKTIWQMSKEVDLNSFYYPTTIIAEPAEVIVTGLSAFPENCKIVIQGTAGQGKSILLRYLASTELKKGTVLPIFVELRKISEKNNLESLIVDGLKQLGIPITEDELEPILSSGKCVLLLDAFDELGSAHVRDSITTIESWCCKFHNLPIIISSRPEGTIQSSTHFNVYNIKKLMREDFEAILSKLFDNKEHVEGILNNIDGKNIASLVSTPLLLTLLAIQYVEEGDVPSNLEGFYENLFHVMCSRHDSTKPGYVREFYSGLNKDDLSNAFNAFCLECNVNNCTSLSFQNANAIAKKALEYAGHNKSSPSLFLEDIVKVTCLLLKEGHQYHYIHKSIMEYHAAKCISNMPESTKIDFYQHSINSFLKNKQVLEFLSSLDNLLYIEYFKIPLLTRIIEDLDFKYVFSNMFFFHNSDITLGSSINRPEERKVFRALDMYYEIDFHKFNFDVIHRLKTTNVVNGIDFYSHIKRTEPDELEAYYLDEFNMFKSKISKNLEELKDFVKKEKEKHNNFNFF